MHLIDITITESTKNGRVNHLAYESIAYLKEEWERK